MVKFRVGKRATPPAETPKVDERLAEAAKAKLSQPAPVEGAVAGETDVSRPGVSDAASDRVAPADLADAAERLGTAEGSTTSTGGASDGGGSSSTGGAMIGSIEEARAGLASGDPTGLTSVADQLAARRPVADLSQGPERQDPFEAIDAAKAGLPGSALREGSNSLLSDASSRDDGVTGIAEQGTGAVSVPENVRSHGPGHFSYVDEGRLIEIKAIHGSDDLRLTYDSVSGELLQETRGIYDAEKSTFAPTVIKHLDSPTGEVITRYVTTGHITYHDKNGVLVDEYRPPPAKYEPIPEKVPTPPPGPSVKIPDEESIGDEFRHISEGLEERLGPRGGGGDGHTDPVDDGGVGGPITESALPDVQEALLGGDPRLGGVVDAAGTSGFRAGLDGRDLSRGAGTIRNPDEEFLGGGLEDDPLDDLGRPGASLDAAPPLSTTTVDDGADDVATDDAAPVAAPSTELADDPIGLFAGSSPIDRSVFGVDRPLLLGATGADGGEETDAGDQDDFVDDEP